MVVVDRGQECLRMNLFVVRHMVDTEGDIERGGIVGNSEHLEGKVVVAEAAHPDTGSSCLVGAAGLVV